MEFNENVIYLEDDDVDDNGTIINTLIPKHSRVFIMIGGNFCHYCKQMKNIFQTIANNLKDKVICAVIILDGELPEEKMLGERVKDFIPGFKGVPEFVLYKNKKFNKTYKGDRSITTLEEFALS